MKKYHERLADVIDNRGQSYGDSRQMLAHIAQRWSLTLGHEVTPNQVAICMIDLKIARLCADPNHADSVLDIGGYAALLDREIQKK